MAPHCGSHCHQLRVFFLTRQFLWRQAAVVVLSAAVQKPFRALRGARGGGAAVARLGTFLQHHGVGTSMPARRFLGTRPNISESHSEIGTRVPFCIEMGGCW